MIHSQLSLSTFQCSTKQRLRFRELVTCLLSATNRLSGEEDGTKKHTGKNTKTHTNGTKFSKFQGGDCTWKSTSTRIFEMNHPFGGKGFPRNEVRIRGDLACFRWRTEQIGHSKKKIQFVVNVGGRGQDQEKRICQSSTFLQSILLLE